MAERIRFPLLPFVAFLLFAGLVRLGAALWLDHLETERVEAALESMRRESAGLVKSIVREERLNAAVRSVFASLSAMPALDAAAVDRFKADLERRHPGLFRLAVLAAPPDAAEKFARDDPIAFDTLLGSDQTQHQLLREFGAFLYNASFLRENRPKELRPGWAKLITAGLIGNPTHPRVIAEKRSALHPVVHGRRQARLAWEILGGGDAPFRGLAILFLFEDICRREFSAERIVELEAAARPGPRILGVASPRPEPPAALAGLASDEVRLLTGVLSRPAAARRGRLLAVFHPLGAGDERYLFATMPREAVFPERRGITVTLDAVLLISFALFAILAHAFAAGRLLPYVPIRLQLAALLLAAATPALSALYFFGLEHLRALRKVATASTVDLIQEEVTTIDNALLSQMQGLSRLGLTFRDRLAANDTLEVLLDRVDPELRALLQSNDDGMIDEYFLYGESGEIVLSKRLDRHAGRTASPADAAKDGVLGNALKPIALTLLRFANGESGSAPRGGGGVLDTIAGFISADKRITEQIIKYRERVHRINVFGTDACIMLEPVARGGSRFTHAFALVFDLELIHKRFMRRLPDLEKGSGRGIRLFSAVGEDRTMRFPNPKEFPAELDLFVSRLNEERAPVSEALTLDGRRTIVAGRPLRVAPEYLAFGAIDESIIDDQVNARARLFQVAFLGTILSALAAAFLLARRIVAPVRRLEAGVAAVAAGDYTVRVEHASRDEFGVLAGRFNEMARGLEEKERMSRYVSDFVRSGVKEGDGRPAARRAKCSILFCDIRSFTTLTESHRPEEIVEMLNGYFDRMTAVIKANGGVVDKFIGDAVMAVFPSGGGAPDELAAVTAALEMRREVARYNAERAAAGLFLIENGIGISTGEVIMGDIGSMERLDRTVIGDHVNLAARLEALSKDGSHTRVIVAGDTRAAVDAYVATVSLGDLTVKGKTCAVPVFEVAGPRPGEALAPLLAAETAALRALGMRLAALGVADPV